MNSKLISGKEVSAQIKAQVKEEVIALNSQGIYPKLSVIIVGENPASLTYVKGKHKDCAECGIISENIAMPETVSQAELLAEIDRLNKDDSVHGILVQLPLPKHIDEYAVVNAISPAKDVDGFTAVNVGNMNIGKDCFTPCTPQGCIDMLDYAGSWAYGDTAGDAPMLSLCAQKVAVNPRRKLLRELDGADGVVTVRWK